MFMIDDLKAEMGVEENDLNRRDEAVRDGSVYADFDKVEMARGSDGDGKTVDNRPTTLGPILIDLWVDVIDIRDGARYRRASILLCFALLLGYFRCRIGKESFSNNLR